MIADRTGEKGIADRYGHLRRLIGLTAEEVFLAKVRLQARLNRERYGGEEHDLRLQMQDWTLIAGTHMGHLMEAVRRGDHDAVEREVLHVAAPLLELYRRLEREREGKAEVSVIGPGPLREKDLGEPLYYVPPEQQGD